MTPPAAARLTGAAFEVCRLTVRSPDKRCDVALPVTASVGDLLPLVLGGGLDGPEASAWVLQRLGGPPLDPGASPESLGLRDGDVLYANPAESALPEADFDDVAIGVAQAVAARRDQWRPEFTRRLLLAAALLVIGAFVVGADSLNPRWLVSFWYALAAAGLTTWSAVANRQFGDRAAGLCAGLAGCALGALSGLAAHGADAGLFTLDRRALVLAGLGLAVPAVVLPGAGLLPVDVFGTLAGWGIAAALGAGIAAGLHWTPVQAAALLAVVVFATGATDLRIVLRAARLRVPLLPRTAQELQEDIDPEPQQVVLRRTDSALSYLNVLFLTAASLTIAACLLLAAQPGWVGRTLAAVLAAASLLRAKNLTLAWQRAALAVAGTVGLAGVLLAQVHHAGTGPRVLALAALLLIGAGLFAASRRAPGRRTLPIWGHAADLLETWTAVALIPLLLQLFHVFAHFRALVH